VINIIVLNSTWETPSESEVFRDKMTQPTWWTYVIRDCTILTTNNRESMINSRPCYFSGYYALYHAWCEICCDIRQVLPQSLRILGQWVRITQGTQMCQLLFIFSLSCMGVPGGAVGWGTALQTGRLRVRFTMVSLEFFIDIILSAALWPWGWLSL